MRVVWCIWSSQRAGVDDTDTGAIDYKLWYRVSLDNGQTYTELKPLIQKGAEYDYLHPISGVCGRLQQLCLRRAHEWALERRDSGPDLPLAAG